MVAILCMLMVTSIGRAQEPLRSETPRLLLYGSITDSNQQPVLGATVRLFPVPSHRPVMSPPLRTKLLDVHPVKDAMTNEQGVYSFDLKPEVLSELRVGVLQEIGVLICHPDHSILVASVSVRDLWIDHPTDWQLKQADHFQLSVVNDRGEPVSGAEVWPARVAGTDLPFKLLAGPMGKSQPLNSQSQSQTDSLGRVEISNFQSADLNEVYIVSESHGKQKVSIDSSGENLRAMVHFLGIVNYQLHLPSDAEKNLAKGRRVLLFSTSSENWGRSTAPLSWEVVTLDSDGKATAKIGQGRVSGILLDDDWPFQPSTQDRITEFPQISPQQSVVELKHVLLSARKFTVTYVDDQQNPLPGLVAYSFGSTLMEDIRYTDVNGSVHFYVPTGEKPTGQLFANDLLGRFSNPSDFGVSLEELQDDNPGKSVQMIASFSVRGFVVDSDGNSIPNAKIQANEYGNAERGNSTRSDKSGAFELRGLTAETEYSISALTEDFRTAKSDVVKVLSGSTENVRIEVTPRPKISASGTVQDPTGMPIADAQITIHQGNESSYGTRFTPQSASAGLTTNSEGVFQFRVVNESAQLTMFQVAAKGFLETTFPAGILQPEDAVQGKLELGTYILHPTPSSRKVTIECVATDQANSNLSNENDPALPPDSAKPVAGATLFVVRPLTGTRKYLSDESGKVEVELDTGPQLIAVQFEGFQNRYQIVDQEGDSVRIFLKPFDANENDNLELTWFARNPAEYRRQARRLMKELQKIDLKSASIERKVLYSFALAAVDSQAFADWIRTDSTIGEDDLLYYVLTDLKSLGFTESLHDLLGSRLSNYQIGVLAEEAFELPDSEDKDERYGEAILLAGEMSGSDKLYALTVIVNYLVLDGRIETAQTLAQEAWEIGESIVDDQDENASRIRSSLASQLAPVYGIVDFGQAMRMIDEHLDGYLASRCRARCLTLAGMANLEKVAEYCQANHIEMKFSFDEQVNRISSFGSIDSRTLAWLEQNCDSIQDPRERSWAALNVARQQTDPMQRQQWLEQAARFSWKASSYSQDDDHLNTLPNQLNRFANLTIRELDALLFQAISNLPARFNSAGEIDTLAAALRVLAMRDAQLARTLIQPLVDTDRWMTGLGAHSPFGSQSTFERLNVIHTAAWIDPAWAAELVIELADEQGPRSADEELCRIQLFSTMICQMMRLASTRPSNSTESD